MMLTAISAGLAAPMLTPTGPRIRPISSLRNGLSLFACGDNLRKGNALNAIQVAERVLGIP